MRIQILGPVFLLSVAMNVGVLGMAAYNRYGRGTDRGTPPPAGPTLREELRLTDGQVRAFTEQRGALHQRVQALRDLMHQRRQEFFEILATPAPDPVAIDRVLKDMNRTQFDMQRAAADYLLAQKQLLTPEQAAAFVRVIARQPGTEEQPRHLPLLGPGGAPLPGERR
jgi:Spy/CpxP family protein refolding chaperone